MTPLPPPQTTLARPAQCAGVGVHSGEAAQVTLVPAPAGHGLRFRRTDVTNRDAVIPALHDYVADTQLGTTLRNRAGVEALTVEHLLSACVGMGLDNAEIQLSGLEAPILDGSALGYATLIAEAGLVELDARRRCFVVRDGGASGGGDGGEVWFTPHAPGESGLTLDIRIEFPHPAIMAQSLRIRVTPDVFLREIAPARTFGFLHEVDHLRAMGRARGASLANTIVLSESGVENREGLRFADEFVRHKALDALGDLALLGGALEGVYHGVRPGHRLTVAAVTAFLAAPDRWTIG